MDLDTINHLQLSANLLKNLDAMKMIQNVSHYLKFPITLLGILSATVLQAAESRPLESVLPEDCVFAAKLANAPQLWNEKMETHPLMNWLMSPQIQDLLKARIPDYQGTEQILKEFEKELGLSGEEMKDLLTGQVLLSVLIDENARTDISTIEEGVGVFLMAEHKSDAATLKGIIQHSAQSDSENEDRVHTVVEESFAGGTLFTETVPATDPAEESEVVGGYWANDCIFVIGNSIEVLKHLALEWENAQSGAFLKKGHLSRFSEKIEGADAWFLIDLKPIGATLEQFIQQKIAEQVATNPSILNSVDPKALIEILELTHFNAICATLNMDKAESEISFDFDFDAGLGLTSLFARPNVVFEFPGFLNPESSSCGYASFSLAECWQFLENSLKRISPMLQMMIDGQLQQFKMQAGVDLKEDLLLKFGGDLFTVASESAPSTVPTQGIVTDQLVIISLKDGVTFEKSLNALLTATGAVAQMTIVPSSDYTLYSYVPRGPNGEPVQVGAYSFCILRDHLFINVGNSGQLLKDTLSQWQQNGPSFRTGSVYAQVREIIPEKGLSWGIQDLSAYLKMVELSIREGVEGAPSADKSTQASIPSDYYLISYSTRVETGIHGKILLVPEKD
jgi:hypothetical protein